MHRRGEGVAGDSGGHAHAQPDKTRPGTRRLACMPLASSASLIWSYDASSAALMMALRATLGPRPVHRPATPSSRMMMPYAFMADGYRLGASLPIRPCACIRTLTRSVGLATARGGDVLHASGQIGRRSTGPAGDREACGIARASLLGTAAACDLPAIANAPVVSAAAILTPREGAPGASPW